MNTYHISVLLQQTIDALEIKTGKRYIDGTIGGGGHTAEILKRGGVVLGIDQDQDALDHVQENFKTHLNTEQLKLVKGNFKDIDEIAKENAFEQVDGVLLDIGISSHHVDVADRGFSFQKEGPLDMRMDREQKIQAGDLINILTKGELYDLFTKLGEERFSRSIVSGIINARKIKRIETTIELAEIIKRAVPFSKKGIHPATKVFQALRIVVNDELHVLEDALPKAVTVLKSGGRLAVITFHSLEDRIVKHTFLEFVDKGYGRILTKKPVIAEENEVEGNNRSRSAKLRVFEKI